MALSQSKVDVFVEDESSLSSEEMKRLGLRIAFYGDEAIPCGFPMRKNEPGLRDSLSYFIDSLIATGEMKEIWDRWLLCENYSEAKVPDMGPVPTGKPLRVAPCTELPPMDYHAGDNWRGLEPELLLRFGRYAGRPVVFEFYPLASAITALQTGKIDIFTDGIFITEERQKTMDFSSSYESIRCAYYVKDENAQASAGFFTKMKEMVYNNLIVENRWTYITDGLWETVKISVFAILLGSLVGAGVCWMRMTFSNPDGSKLQVLKDINCEISKGEVISNSPIQDIDQSLMIPVKELSKGIVEEPTTLGFRVKVIV